MDKRLVSIIIPVYNAEKFLADAISSALDQQWPNVEIIVVDDGSTDSSLPVANRFRSDKVKVISQENRGASAARNVGLSRANGDFIQFLDADDLLSPDKIYHQVNLLNENPWKVAVCNTIHFMNGGKPADFIPSEHEERFLIDSDPVNFLINLWGGYGDNGSMVQPNAWLSPRSVIEKAGKWNEQLTLDDDGEFFCRVLLNSTGVVKSEGYNYYRKFNDTALNLSSLLNKKALESATNAAMLKKKYLFKYSASEAAQKAIYRQFLFLAIQSYMTQPELYRILEKELKCYPDWRITPTMGGYLINKVAEIFGWHTARRLQYYWSKLNR